MVFLSFYQSKQSHFGVVFTTKLAVVTTATVFHKQGMFNNIHSIHGKILESNLSTVLSSATFKQPTRKKLQETKYSRTETGLQRSTITIKTQHQDQRSKTTISQLKLQYYSKEHYAQLFIIIFSYTTSQALETNKGLYVGSESACSKEVR